MCTLTCRYTTRRMCALLHADIPRNGCALSYMQIYHDTMCSLLHTDIPRDGSMGYYCVSRTLKMVMLILLILIFYNNVVYMYCQIYMVMLFSTAKSVISLIQARFACLRCAAGGYSVRRRRPVGAWGSH